MARIKRKRNIEENDRSEQLRNDIKKGTTPKKVIFIKINIDQERKMISLLFLMV